MLTKRLLIVTLSIVRPIPNIVQLLCRTQNMNLAWQWHHASIAWQWFQMLNLMQCRAICQKQQKAKTIYEFSSAQ